MPSLALSTDAALDVVKKAKPADDISQSIASPLHVVSFCAKMLTAGPIVDKALSTAPVNLVISKSSHAVSIPVSYATKQTFSLLTHSAVQKQVEKVIKSNYSNSLLSQAGKAIVGFLAPNINPDNQFLSMCGTLVKTYSQDKSIEILSKKINEAIQPLFAESIDVLIEDQIAEFTKSQIKTFVVSYMLALLYNALFIDNTDYSQDRFKEDVNYWQNINNSINILTIYFVIFSFKMAPVIYKLLSENGHKKQLKKALSEFIIDRINSEGKTSSYDSLIPYVADAVVETNSKATNEYLSLAINAFNTSKIAVKHLSK